MQNICHETAAAAAAEGEKALERSSKKPKYLSYIKDSAFMLKRFLPSPCDIALSVLSSFYICLLLGNARNNKKAMPNRRVETEAA